MDKFTVLLLALLSVSAAANLLQWLSAVGQRKKRQCLMAQEAADGARERTENARLREELLTAARKDHVTGLWNRTYFTELLDEALSKKAPLTLALLKLDDFKLYNELYGSEEGDKALRLFADVLRETVGETGILGSSGVDFYLALPELSPAAAMGILRVCRERLLDLAEGKRAMTFSGGLCAYPKEAGSRGELITFAGIGLEEAKRCGKDQLVIYGEDKDELLNRVEKLGQEYAPTIYALTAAIDAKDHYTCTHCENVTRLATQLARAAGFAAEYVEMIRQAGLLHDVGKISIPESVLTKPSRLTSAEYEIMKSHVERSIEIIRHLPSLNYVVPIVVGHHERWDGKGYPRGLAGTEIPRGARCVALADAFDAIVSRRVYKAAVPLAEAIDEIERGLGTQFDPELGALFVRLLRSGELEGVVSDRGGSRAG